MIKALIIDDEKHCAEILKIELDTCCPDVKVIGVASSGQEGIKLIIETNPDLVFLDIEMPQMNGFEVLKNLTTVNFDLIFVTAYDQYALKAFRFSAIDYLLKPVDSKELQQATNKIKSRNHHKIGAEQIEYLLKNINQKDHKFNRIGLPTGTKIEFVEVNNIIRCQAEGNYCKVSILGSKVMLLSKTLKSMEQNLKEYNFLRVHNSHLVNPQHVISFERIDGGLLHMSDNSTVHITRYSKQEILHLLNI